MRSGIPAPNDDEILARVYDVPLAPAGEHARNVLHAQLEIYILSK
jgi:hypothetical protein